LVRAADAAAGHARILDALQRHGIEPAPGWAERLEPVVGDLAAPGLGLDPAEWRRLAETVDSIYHLAASVNVLLDYPSHGRTNVAPLVEVVRLAAEHHPKPLFHASPMAVCRRRVEGRLEVLPEERVHADPAGLLTGYARSKWAAEQVLLAAAARGLPVTIYRTSHALPSARTGRAKPGDTFASVLRAARAAGVVPEWADSAFHGVPVDVLGRLVVEDSLGVGRHPGVVHVENRDPLTLPALLEALLGGDAPRVPLEEWKARCLEAASALPDEDATLVRVLFADRADGAAVENMFGRHPLQTDDFDRRGRGSALADLTPAAYWRRVQGAI
ncbi:MAG TPA: SDR family oxidoreductase, partial [Longimicrobiaceae bacterium]|nr:SDR family oxidoreductase [Longimicrobiaceae bacterium]